MSFELGINVDPRRWVDTGSDLTVPADLVASGGMQSSRHGLVLGREDVYRAYERLLADRGVVPVRCLTGESFTDDEKANGTFKDRIAAWRQELGDVVGYWEAGNEPEPGAGEASWPLDPTKFGSLLAQARQAVANDFLISGGLVSGQPGWLDDVPEVKECNAKGIHFYEARPDKDWPTEGWTHGYLPDTLEKMEKAFARDKIPWAVTEVGGIRGWFEDENQRADFHRRTLEGLERSDCVRWVLVFCLDTLMHPEYGLRVEGESLASFTACTTFALRTPVPRIPPPSIPQPQPGGIAVGQTLEKFMAENAAKLGKTWVAPRAGVIKRAAVTDHHLLIEYEDAKGETWVTPLKQDDSFFRVAGPAYAPLWVGSQNFVAGRGGQAPIALVIHTMAGSLPGCDATFKNTASQVSAHVGIGLDGTIHEYVKPEDTAWANGRLEEGHRWPGPAGVNPNEISLSVETEDRGNPQGEPVTDAQYAATLAWASAMRERYPSVKYVVSHRAISPKSRSCPGARWIDSGRLEALARDLELELVQ